MTGKYQGGQLERKLSGYQNFCSKLFLDAKRNLASDQSLEIEKIETKDVWRELGKVWRELTDLERQQWNAFASGKASMPVMDRFVQRPTRGVSRERSVIEDPPKTEHEHDPLKFNSPFPQAFFNVEDYLSKFKIKELLEQSLNEAVAVQCPDPRIFIADKLLLAVAKEIAWERVEKNVQLKASDSRMDM